MSKCEKCGNYRYKLRICPECGGTMFKVPDRYLGWFPHRHTANRREEP